MKRDNQPWLPVEPASLEWSDEGVPRSRQFGDVYYSRDDGLSESTYTFLKGNDLPARWQQQPDRRFCIFETGFGTGLNFLLTWQAWRELPEPRPPLHYIAVEKHPLQRQDLERALSLWPALKDLVVELLQQWPGLAPGQHRLVLQQGQLCLDLWWEDAGATLADLARRATAVDAWYLDGFAPSCNAGMWHENLFQAMGHLSRTGSSFATFTAAGDVRRGLQAAGFEVRKAPGFGRKRDCLRGEFRGEPMAASAPTITPWDLSAERQRPDSALVLGAGLAGCTVAAALARRGIKVTLLEQGVVAGQGSANEQGILYTRLSRRHSALSDFALQSFQFAARFYRQQFRDGLLEAGVDGELCGSFHLGLAEADLAALESPLQQVAELAQVLPPAAASELLGVNVAEKGLWLPGSGWLRPAAVCRALLATPGITLLEHCGKLELVAEGEHWLAHNAAGEVARGTVAVISTGCAAPSQAGLDWLPLQSIRGQTTHLPSSRALQQLRAALCHEGYIAPARQGRHCIGATFDLQDDGNDLRPGDHQHNLGNLASAVPEWAEELAGLEPTALEGRVGFRCASPDYLPMVGPVPDRDAFLQTYAGLRKNARQVISQTGPYMPGLFLNTAHGSRGLSSTPLCGEWLASLICAEAAPFSSELQRALAPARFLVRDLSRNRI